MAWCLGAGWSSQAVRACGGRRRHCDVCVQRNTEALQLPFSPGHFRSADLGDAASDRSLNLSKRRLPRSKAQLIVDAAEDAELDDIPVTQLNLSHLQMTAISGRVWNLDRLETLDLRGNKLDRIPSAIQDLTALVHLDVSHNRLATLPVGLQTTASLRHLHASHNRIETFSPKLWKLRGLLSLDLSYNLMADLPFVEGDLRLLRETSAWQVSIGLLTALTSLNLSNNNLVKCPALIDNCTALTTVDLSYNAIPSLETEFGNLRALETCYLQHNALVELPDSWGRLASLHTLDVSHNHLTSLPASVGNCTALAALDASYNDLSALPATIKSLSMLRRLDLSHNSALVFPNVLPALTSLETVVFDHCNLPDLPTNALAYTADMPLYSICLGLESLDLSFNRLATVPDDLVRLFELRMLKLDNNKLRHLPGRLGFLQKLEHLDMSHNVLQWLPTTCHHLVNVKFVSAAFNQLERRPPYFYDKAVFVDWSGNPFNATEVMVRPLLEMAAQAKHDLEHRNYKTAAALFTALLNQASAVSVMSKELEPIRAHATFYRGICRYQQICRALSAIEALSIEASTIEQKLNEQRLVEPWDVMTLSTDDRHASQTQLDSLIQEKIELRTAVQEWKLEAQADFKQAIRYQVEPTTAAFTLGSLYAKTFQLPEAIEMLTHALKYFTNGITQGAVPILLQRAEAWEQLGQPPMANDDYKLVLTVDPSHDIAIARLAALETHQAKYHVGFDTDAHKRAFVMEPNGICHRRNDPTISLTRLNEIDSPTKFAEACDSLRDAKQRAMYIEVTKKVEAKKSRQGRVTQVKQLMREIQERQAMEREEEDQLEREAAIEFFRRQKALEWQREENERQWMQYEEASQRWVESELERIRLEELAALEEARRKAEAKAEYKKRLARRGGLRQGGRSGKR
ncbi:hypothetical protein H310_11885 [Aphanomyces invadans]|uniref:Uncharacterized protein n=1 Tax=Aphanomyces invadans TaxID=157072 RepID=A0A024TLW7_9STRA|nr:hypothetical protein H310_11885 [Aphanomyces invadans]ETV94626.1 hypothetical protein H310_11885 [Aphanomyces invadans]|eukprot:XP_008876941.1 hypothetical protein H310_11885 [Aphanomyces invadans]